MHKLSIRYSFLEFMLLTGRRQEGAREPRAAFVAHLSRVASRAKWEARGMPLRQAESPDFGAQDGEASVYANTLRRDTGPGLVGP